MALSADDVVEIIDLGHRYDDAVDRHDVEAWTQTWASDGELRSPLGNPVGHDALLAWISRATAALAGTRHLALNELVDGDGDHATMRSCYIVVDVTATPPAIAFAGAYDDELVRVDGRWRFRRRVHTLDGAGG